MEDFYYWNGVSWLVFPAWGKFFIRLGAAVSSQITVNRRLIATISIPTRSYAAALAAFGVVVSRSFSAVEQSSASERFELLLQVKKGTPVTLLKEGVRHKGAIEGPCSISDRTWLRIKIRRGEFSAWTLVGESAALDVEIISDEQEEIPKRITGKPVMPISPFTESIIGANKCATFATTSRLDCLLVGRLNKLQAEISRTKFAVGAGPNGQFNIGALQEVLRVHSFLDPSEHFRADIVSTSSRRIAKAPSGVPAVVAFDGSASFLRSRGLFADANWIVLLDRTEPNFSEAMTICNQDYVKRRIDDSGLKGLSDIPNGIDLVSYYESRR
jgi:hypothetical protein